MRKILNRLFQGLLLTAVFAATTTVKPAMPIPFPEQQGGVYVGHVVYSNQVISIYPLNKLNSSILRPTKTDTNKN